MSTTLHVSFQPYGTAPAATIEVNSASFDAEQALNIGSQSSGAGAGKITFNPFSFTKKPDAHSADLWARLCSGTPFQRASFSATASGAVVPFFTFTMGLVAIKTMSFSTTEGDGVPLETITMEYGQAAYSVAIQNPDGSMGKPMASGWDRVRNVAEDPAKVGAA